MTWSRAKLEDVTKGRLSQRAQLEPVERAALAYARWQGLTDEDGIDTNAAKRALDAALEDLDATGPAGWIGLENLAPDLGDPALVGLMRYSLQRGITQVQSQIPEASLTAKPRKKRNQEM